MGSELKARKLQEAKSGAMEEKNERGNSWPMCSVAKTRCMKDGEKTLEGHCGDMWERCGAELKAHKEQEAKSGAMEKKKERADSWPMCSMAKTRCMKNGEKIMEGHCGDSWE